MSKKRPPLLTGSQAYGTPTNKSDIDLVIFQPDNDLNFLLEQFSDNPFLESTPNELGHSLRFGKLNLIILEDEKDYDLWYKATKECIHKKPLNKKETLDIFSKYMDVYFPDSEDNLSTE